MDRNEAIKLIDERMCFGRGKWSEYHVPEIDDYWKAGKMAIKVLEGKDTNVPTKEEVIPMEWIEKKRDELVSNYKYIIDWLILEWEKEQGEIYNDNQ